MNLPPAFAAFIRHADAGRGGLAVRVPAGGADGWRAACRRRDAALSAAGVRALQR